MKTPSQGNSEKPVKIPRELEKGALLKFREGPSYASIIGIITRMARDRSREAEVAAEGDRATKMAMVIGINSVLDKLEGE